MGPHCPDILAPVPKCSKDSLDLSAKLSHPKVSCVWAVLGLKCPKAFIYNPHLTSASHLLSSKWLMDTSDPTQFGSKTLRHWCQNVQTLQHQDISALRYLGPNTKTVPTRDRGIMRLCARIIGDLPHNWANPASSNELRIICLIYEWRFVVHQEFCL